MAEKRTFEGVVTKHDGPEDAVAWWAVDSEEDGLCSDAILEDFEGKRVRLTVEVVEEKQATPPNEIDLDGIVDEQRAVSYIGKAKQQPDGKYIALASVGDALCRVEVSITPTVIGKDPEWEKGLGNG